MHHRLPTEADIRAANKLITQNKKFSFPLVFKLPHLPLVSVIVKLIGSQLLLQQSLLLKASDVPVKRKTGGIPQGKC